MSMIFTNLMRTGLAAWMLLLSASLSAGTYQTARPPAAGDPTKAAVGEAEPICGNEVRMRRLHLVRPDLIKYPIAIEIYC